MYVVEVTFEGIYSCYPQIDECIAARRFLSN